MSAAPASTDRPALRRPSRIGARTRVLIGIVVAGAWSAWQLDLSFDRLVPGEGGLEILQKFLSRAFTPALTSEADYVPPNSPSLLWQAADAAWQTLLFAAAAMSLALVLGVSLGYLASSAWWRIDAVYGTGDVGLRRWLRRALFPVLYLISRTTIALLRSVHELVWAVLLVTAFGLTDAAALLALALPYGGTLAKLFSELVDEAPRPPAAALRGLGASGAQVYWFALVAQALPDLIAYAFYRLECALRSSAVLGFFGFPTLGLALRQSFLSSNYGEVWTYLYFLFVLIFLFDTWSGTLRRRLLA